MTVRELIHVLLDTCNGEITLDTEVTFHSFLRNYGETAEQVNVYRDDDRVLIFLEKDKDPARDYARDRITKMFEDGDLNLKSVLQILQELREGKEHDC